MHDLAVDLRNASAGIAPGLMADLTTIILDIETRSALQLPRVGAHRYAAHATTEILCLAYAGAGDEAAPVLWYPGEPAPAELLEHIRDGGRIAAWNVAFDFQVWNSKTPPDWPRLRLEQIDDIAAQAAAAGMPRRLEHCAKAIGLTERKDAEGRRLMLALSKPGRRDYATGRLVWPAIARDKLERLGAYCVQDVVVERQLHRLLPRLQACDRPIWELDFQINARGLQLDPQLFYVAGVALQRHLAAANRRIAALTGGAVRTVNQRDKIIRFVEGHGIRLTAPAATEPGNPSDDPSDEDDEDAPAGNSRGKLARLTVQAVLQRPDLLAPVREVLQLRFNYGRAAAAKIPTAAGAVGADGRIRDCLAYHAAHTGRAGGRILQPQNLPRRSYDAAHWDAVLADLKALPAAAFQDKHNVSPVTAITWLLRGAIVARRGHTLVGGDLDKIELCVGAWAVRQENLLADLRAGVDTYRKLAARIYGVPVDLLAADSDERQVGKSGMLGCIFGLGPDTFREFVRNNTEGKVTIDRATAVATIGAFRETYPRFPLAWREIGAAAIAAVHCPGTAQPCLTGRVHWRCTGDRRWLLCTLPSGRRVRYFRPHLVLDDGPFGPNETLKTWSVSKFTHQWGAERRWGSLLFENIVQAIARDLLMLAALKVTNAGFDVVLHVHDELLIETPRGALAPWQLNTIMRDAPEWATGLPVTAECWEGPRYG